MQGENMESTIEGQTLEKLNKINQKSQKDYFSIDDLDWTQEVDQNINWAPEQMAPLRYLPSFNLLSEEQKRYNNQLFALNVCEQFIWLENDLLLNILTHAMENKNLPQALRTALEHFYEEEEKHQEMFWRVLELARPSWYKGDRTFKVFKLSKANQLLFRTIRYNPSTLLVWIWLALFFEERTSTSPKITKRPTVAKTTK